MGSRLEENSARVRKRIENHTFDAEDGDEYDAAEFGGFGDYFRRKKIKLQNLDAELRSQSNDTPQIFRGVVAHVNGYTQPSLNDLHKLIVVHGGGFLQYLDGKTTATHIVASNLTPKKAVEFKRYRIVKPAWIVESVKAGRLLPWDSFRLLDEGAGQRVLGFDNGSVISQSSRTRRSYKEESGTSWYASQLRKTTESPFQLSKQDSTLDVDDLEAEELDPIVDSMIEDIKQPPSGEDNHLSEIDQADQVFAVASKEAPKLQANDTIQEQMRPVAGPSGDKKKLTAEEHNAILLADPRIRKSTVVNPGFLEQYYRESRLHHLSTWKAELKSQLQAAAQKASQSPKRKQKSTAGSRRYILHVDFDSFFAAVSLKKHPQYKDKPAVVAHGQGSSSEIASCNYPARKFGIKNGMWMKRAMELCPNLQILPYDFPGYEEASRAFYDAIIVTGGVVQSVSIDEALLDVTAMCVEESGSDGRHMTAESIYREQAKADDLAQQLRDTVKTSTGCDVSVGIGGNILLAKVALRKAKPAGQCQIRPEEVLRILGELEVQSLPGVAWSIGGKLEDLGAKSVKDLRDLSKEKLVTALGPKTGEKLYEYARGIDRSEVGEVVVRKSVSAEVNWGVRFENQQQVDEFIENLCGELHKRLLKEQVKGRQLTLKIMKRSANAPLDPPKHLGHGKCDTSNKSVALGVTTNSPDILTGEVLSMLKSMGFPPGELRGIGVQMTKLEPLKPPGPSGQDASSQKRLQFKPLTSHPAKTAASNDPIQDDPITPRKPRYEEDFATPTKQSAEDKEIKSAARLFTSGSPSKKRLNTAGTQFIMPTQVDPEVLAELPEDIRSKLTKTKEADYAPAAHPDSTDRPKPVTQSALYGLPNQSQLDMDTVNALPEDLREEILRQYEQQRERTKSPLQISAAKNIKQPAPKKRGRPPKGTTSSKTGLLQTNFVTSRSIKDALRGVSSPEPETAREVATENDPDIPEISQEFLAALPEDVRREVLEEHRRLRLQKRSLNIGNGRRNKPRPDPVQTPSAAGRDNNPSRTVFLPAKPAKPKFTAQKLSALPDLRDAMKAWSVEFKEEGPYLEDVDALGAYLVKVIEDERNMDKAASVVKWLAWVLGDKANEEWGKALDRLRETVQDAVKRRRLGTIDLE
ncbi:DNA repair protein [Eremomyces bilateralis CBS 781.70]|uniref:DNA repair protein REV1 n=1 Tax=Eremomyces bilateralis CBS 781.70 TaxID=1392243 RepID=A0A6G1FY56_9PEZI|nr:DNA repair protein [Eremomyces bilateralis CBS 781.70]KAF1810733.1 DNA repair protein [Eremomyces bilateralis CBS 781.70]